jgi:hypothetical protein
MPYIGKKPADIIATAVDTTTGTFSGDIDVDGTTNLDVVDIDGAVNMATTALVTGVLTANGGAVFNEAGADVDFRVESDTVDHALFVNGANGNVGIGTSSPATKFEVLGGRSLFSPNSENFAIGLKHGATGHGTMYIGATTGLTPNFQISAGTGAALVNVTYGGNLGIGTTSPSAKLQVEGTLTVRTSSNQTFNDSSNANNLTMTDSKVHFNVDGADKDFQVSSDTITHALFVEGSSGKVGIGD